MRSSRRLMKGRNGSKAMEMAAHIWSATYRMVPVRCMSVLATFHGSVSWR